MQIQIQESQTLPSLRYKTDAAYTTRALEARENQINMYLKKIGEWSLRIQYEDIATQCNEGASGVSMLDTRADFTWRFLIVVAVRELTKRHFSNIVSWCCKYLTLFRQAWEILPSKVPLWPLRMRFYNNLEYSWKPNYGLERPIASHGWGFRRFYRCWRGPLLHSVTLVFLNQISSIAIGQCVSNSELTNIIRRLPTLPYMAGCNTFIRVWQCMIKTLGLSGCILK